MEVRYFGLFYWLDRCHDRPVLLHAHPSGEQEEEGSGRTAQQPEDRR